MATALVEPRENVREHQLHIFVRLTGGETMPHPRVELEGLVGASWALVEGTADLRVGHCVCLAVENKEWHPHLEETYLLLIENLVHLWIEKAKHKLWINKSC